MTEKIYLISGHTSSGRLAEIDSQVLRDSKNKSLMILNLSFQDKEKLLKKKEFLNGYFKDLGAENIFFFENQTSNEQLNEQFQEAGLLYLPGGDTKILLANIRSKDLISRIKSFDGVLAGNSAGAYSFCPDYLRIGRGMPEIISALGIVDFWIKANYEPKFNNDLVNLSKERQIYALENESAIVIDKDLSFIGNIWEFSRGNISKISSK